MGKGRKRSTAVCILLAYIGKGQNDFRGVSVVLSLLSMVKPGSGHS